MVRGLQHIAVLPDPRLLVALVLLAGCSAIEPPPLAEHADAQKPVAEAGGAGVPQVRVGGDCLALGEAEQQAVTASQLIDAVEGFLARDQYASAGHFARRYPDIALEALRRCPCAQAGHRAVQAIAAIYDGLCTRADPGDAWRGLMADKSQNPDRYAAHETKRQQFMEHLRAGHPERALDLGITEAPAEAPGVLLRIDAWQLAGTAHLMANEPAKAARAFERAVQLAGTAHPHQAAHLMLLLSEARRRTGQGAAADATWADAVDLAGRLLEPPAPVIDPGFWERAAYLRPVGSPWPAPVRQRLAHWAIRQGLASSRAAQAMPASSATGRGRSLLDERPLWACIGLWRLERDEPQAALVALKRAETMTVHPADVDRLHLVQARALAQLGQTPAATAILVRLAAHQDPTVARRAMAILGSLKLQSGGISQGFNLLQRAIEHGETAPWPGRAEAEADLGLAYLLLGDARQGLRWLHSAQARFQGAGDTHQLVQCMDNEASFLEQAGRADEAESLRSRIRAIETGHLPPEPATRHPLDARPT